MPKFTKPAIKIGQSNVAVLREELQTEMSRVADFDRNRDGMNALFSKVDKLCGEFFDVVEINDLTQTAELFKLYDMVLTQRATLSAMLCSAEVIGTHGSAFVDRLPGACADTPRATRTLTKGAHSHLAPISPMPQPELWFETLLARRRLQG